MFLAHTSDLSYNQYKVLDQYNKQKVLVNKNGYKLVSNICPHQQSLISLAEGKGNRICPYHNWSFTIDGSPLTSGRTDYYCKNKNPLPTSNAHAWNNLLLSEPIDLEEKINLLDLSLMEYRVDIVHANYKNIMDLFLDVDHIQTVHTGVYDLVGITNTEVEWKYFESGSIQLVQQGARWISIYPYTMIEWQQGCLFVTVAKKSGHNLSEVLVYKYGNKNDLTGYELNQHVWETAWAQDKKQAELLTRFNDCNLEPQKIHFRNFLKRNGID